MLPAEFNSTAYPLLEVILLSFILLLVEFPTIYTPAFPYPIESKFLKSTEFPFPLELIIFLVTSLLEPDNAIPLDCFAVATILLPSIMFLSEVTASIP